MASDSAPSAEERRESGANVHIGARSSMTGPLPPVARATSDDAWRKLPRRKTAASLVGNGSANCTVRQGKSMPHADATPRPKRGRGWLAPAE
jgi:hypothetical protein